jgi:hypothetical protein
LAGTIRKRVIIQCKHYTSQSISVSDIAILKEVVKAWSPPSIDYLVIATSGRFTQDAVQYIESHNATDAGMKIEMWADSAIEAYLSRNPGISVEFGLR